MLIENLSTLKINKLTQQQYDRELSAGNIDENALYLTPDESIDLSNYATKEYVSLKIPPCSTEDNGKILCVVDGIPTWVNIPM